VAIYGCGQAGRFALRFCRDHGIEVGCFFDDDQRHWGKVIDGVRVVASSKISELADGFRQVIIASYAFEHLIYTKLEAAGVKNMVFLRDFPVHTANEPCPVENQQERLPGIIVSTMPKSGTVNIQQTLYASLKGKIRHIQIDGGYWPHNTIHEPSLRRLVSEGSLYTVLHCQPSQTNIWDLEDLGVDRVVVHCRDPRQALLSLVHWFNRRHQEGIIRRCETPPAPGYFELPLREQIDKMIDYRFPFLVEYAKGWFEVARRGKLKVLFTDFVAMKNNPQKFYGRILEFYGIDRQKASIRALAAEPGKRHFRQGSVDEWRQVFTSGQIEKTTMMIPAEVREFFKW